MDDDTVIDQRRVEARAIDSPGFGEFFPLRLIVVGIGLAGTSAAASMGGSVSTIGMSCNATAIWRAHRKGAFFANPCYPQIHPTTIPSSNEFQGGRQLRPVPRMMRACDTKWP